MITSYAQPIECSAKYSRGKLVLYKRLSSLVGLLERYLTTCDLTVCQSMIGAAERDRQETHLLSVPFGRNGGNHCVLPQRLPFPPASA